MKKLLVFLFISFLGLSCNAQKVSVDNYVDNQGAAGYFTIDGVLYISDGSSKYIPYILVRYPIGKTNRTFEIPEKVKYIAPNAFKGNKYLTTIIFPSCYSKNTGTSRALVISASAFDDTNIEEFITSENTSSVSSARVTPKGDDTKYNLQGMQIDSPQKGEVYIQDGKKYVNK